MKNLFILFSIIITFTACSDNYSQGERIGIITKFSNKGVMCKSWEGDLKVAPNIAGGGMVGQYEDFLFSVDNDNSIPLITSTDSINEFMREGIPVVVTYQQTIGRNWFSNRGETNYFIKSVVRASNVNNNNQVLTNNQPIKIVHDTVHVLAKTFDTGYKK